MRADVAIVGDGPAGSALAAACAGAGLDVLHLGGDPDAAWPATYGAWVDELDGVEAVHQETWSHRWDRPLVATDEGGERALPRAYGLLANEVLRGDLRAATRTGGGRVEAARVTGAVHDAEGTRLALAGGGERRARVVVDATGHRAALLESGSGRTAAHQVAYGVVAPVRRSPVPEGGMLLMDWRTPHGAGGPPTFLYAMDLGDGLQLLEETSLAARPGLGIPHLRERLQRRLAAIGAEVGEPTATEHVAFPMGGPLPARPQPVLGYGAAAGMVHPATGYQVAAALRRAPQVAAALARALDAGTDPVGVAAAGWAAVWPEDLVRQRALHVYGLELLLTLDAREVQRFFDAFFSLPDARWRAYLSGARSSRELAGVMLAVARRLPPPLRRRVARGALGPDGSALLRAVVRSG